MVQAAGKAFEPMKLVVLILAVVASLKLGYQEYLYRASTGAAIVAAYQGAAIKACRQAARSQGLASAMAKPKSVAFRVGNRNLDVFIWQIDDANWRAKYTTPYVLVTPHDKANLHCAYDVHGRAARIMKG